jgi:DNA-binding CsgD family transcriptional regulator
VSEWRKIWANGLPNEGRSPKSGHRMAAERMQFPRRWSGDTISLNLGGIWEMSVHIGMKLGSAQSIAEAIRHSAGSDTVGVVTVTYDGRPDFMNDLAGRIFGGDDGLSVTRHGVHAARRTDNIALNRLLAEALATSRGDGIGAGGMLTISRPSQRRPYAVMISPLRNQDPDAEFSLPGAVIIIRDPDLDIQTSAKTLQQLFHLTHAEASLAAKFFETTSLGEAAEELNLTQGTARQYLKSVFLKTDTHNQAALIKLLARLATVRTS